MRTLYGAILRAGSVTDRLEDVRLPVLAIAGAEDRSFSPEQMRTMAGRLPDAEFHVIEWAGHALAIEQPDMVARRLVEFLGRTAAAA